jgi:hypothetical protein
MEPRILRIELPPGFKLISSNDRPNHYQRAKLTRDIKAEAARLIKGEKPFGGKVRIRAVYSPGTRHRHDPGNLYPSVKAAVDALVPSIIPDDSSRYVTEVSLVVADRIVKGGQLVIQVIDDAGD